MLFDADVIDRSVLTDDDARAAGEPDLASLLSRMSTGPDRQLHRIRFHLAGDDPLIAANPGVRSADLCREVDMEQAELKTRVRRLKSLGLTERLERGYRLSPRGRTFLDRRG
ncbi:hypothetical protein [Actinospongicola halichondriae]|uniref:hypothetical protein n=1 Tax=Actinospongicola halichondriae TaxID=3236844 RepID=UPI003D3D980A